MISFNHFQCICIFELFFPSKAFKSRIITYLINKTTPGPDFMWFSSPSNTQIVFVSSRRSPCICIVYLCVWKSIILLTQKQHKPQIKHKVNHQSTLQIEMNNISENENTPNINYLPSCTKDGLGSYLRCPLLLHLCNITTLIYTPNSGF